MEYKKMHGMNNIKNWIHSVSLFS